MSFNVVQMEETVISAGGQLKLTRVSLEVGLLCLGFGVPTSMVFPRYELYTVYIYILFFKFVGLILGAASSSCSEFHWLQVHW